MGRLFRCELCSGCGTLRALSISANLQGRARAVLNRVRPGPAGRSSATRCRWWLVGTTPPVTSTRIPHEPIELDGDEGDIGWGEAEHGTRDFQRVSPCSNTQFRGARQCNSSIRERSVHPWSTALIAHLCLDRICVVAHIRGAVVELPVTSPAALLRWGHRTRLFCVAEFCLEVESLRHSVHAHELLVRGSAFWQCPCRQRPHQPAVLHLAPSWPDRGHP